MGRTSYTYMMTNKNKTALYTGVTSNLVRRVHEHKAKKHQGFTAMYNLNVLVYYELHHDVEEAIHREKQLEKKFRLSKERLIAK